MKALAWFGARGVRMVDAPIPDVTEPHDVLLKVTGTAICGSDLHLYHGEIVQLQQSDILGHEFMGIVDRVGPNVKKTSTSASALSPRFKFPEANARTAKKTYPPCATAPTLPGIVNLLPIPDSVPDEKELFLSDILPTSYHAFVDVGVQRAMSSAYGAWGIETIDFNQHTDVVKRIQELVPGGLVIAIDVLTGINSRSRARRNFCNR
ncbi:chaperonin 10-like protein [Mycena rosella]|uniref:Chaperonin 10-like protein n=1 Tax=Mycena rosella TaxID=1033263 RepID=A0AAD7DB91_MYCRO|nr:chaperonin 10-like protein [Mycena rosella]